MERILFEGCSKNEFIEELKQFIQEELDKNNLTITQIEPPCNIEEATDFVGVALGTMYEYTSKRIIPHYKKGKRLFFFKSELSEWLKEGKVKTLKDIDQEAKDYLLNKNKPK